jgi:hypothetical protein
MNQELTNLRPPISPGCSNAFIFVVGRLFPLSFGLGSMIFLGVGLWMINKGIQSENWDKGTATITSSEIEKTESRSKDAQGFTQTSTSYSVRVTYAYTVEGNNYEGNTVGFGTMSHNERSDAQEELKSYPKGKTIDVYYDPENPSDSVLNKGVFWPMYIVIVVMVIMLIGSIWASFALTKYLKKRTAQAMALVQEKADDNEHPFSKYS